VHGIVYVAESESNADPLEKEIKQLSELLDQVKDEQGYIVVRERTHRNTAESTNARVKWWSIFQIGILAGNAVFSVWWTKRFFEVSRCPDGTMLKVTEANRETGQKGCIVLKHDTWSDGRKSRYVYSGIEDADGLQRSSRRVRVIITLQLDSAMLGCKQDP